MSFDSLKFEPSDFVKVCRIDASKQKMSNTKAGRWIRWRWP